VRAPRPRPGCSHGPTDVLKCEIRCPRGWRPRKRGPWFSSRRWGRPGRQRSISTLGRTPKLLQNWWKIPRRGGRFGGSTEDGSVAASPPAGGWARHSPALSGGVPSLCAPSSRAREACPHRAHELGGSAEGGLQTARPRRTGPRITGPSITRLGAGSLCCAHRAGRRGRTAPATAGERPLALLVDGPAPLGVSVLTNVPARVRLRTWVDPPCGATSGGRLGDSPPCSLATSGNLANATWQRKGPLDHVHALSRRWRQEVGQPGRNAAGPHPGSKGPGRRLGRPESNTFGSLSTLSWCRPPAKRGVPRNHARRAVDVTGDSCLSEGGVCRVGSGAAIPVLLVTARAWVHRGVRHLPPRQNAYPE
jgi:hypothetical protein